jgi:hypothetical protein
VSPLTGASLAAGTIPIYWGSAVVMQTFDPAGILYVEDMAEVQVCVANVLLMCC